MTKLHVPGRRPDTVSRSRLLDRLDAGLRARRRLTLISAPAGYGKTTVATDWLHAQTSPFTWVGLDEADNDPHRFLTYLIAALERVDPAYGTGARSLLRGAQSTGTAPLTLLINDLVEVGSPVIVVLDDYHLIRAPEVHTLVEFLLEHAPDLLHLVVLTREDPPLPFSRLRVRGQLTELRAADLRFTPEEIAAFFRETLDLALDTEAVATLSRRTEGWIASLQLAGLALRSQPEPHAFLAQFGGSHRYVIDYLIDEVLSHQPPDVRDFLSRTSVLDRFCAPLCDALVREDGKDEGPASPADDILQRLDRANLFLVALDERRTWYRYHHLFADVLRSGLAPETARRLHRRAAHWFADAGLTHEAIRHALEAGDHVDAAAWIHAASSSLIRHGQIATLLGWLDALPGPVIADHPELTATKAMGLLLTGQLDDVDSMLAALDGSEVEPGPALEGKLLTVRTWLADARGEPRAADTAERALALLPADAVLYRILALIPLSHARTEAGDIGGSTEALRDAYRLATDADQPFAAMGALANLAFNLLEQGKRREALALCETACARTTDDRGRPLPVLGLVYLPMATASYIGDDLDRAEHYAREGLALCRDLFSGTMAGGDAERVLARVTFARGERDAALAFLEEARLSAESRGITHVALVFAATSAMLRLRVGETVSVGRWLASLGEPLPREVRSAHLAWLLAAGRWEAAESQLAARARQLEESEQFGRLIYVLLMQAQAAAGQGQRADALGYLEAAVKRAAPDGYRRPFLDAPVEVQMLLPYVRTTAPAFVDDLLGRSDLDVTPSDARETLIEPLSDRELEVLGLIAAGLSNREIAERLFITVGTVKRHAHNLYGKLQVGNRTEAVARARELTII